MPQRGESKQAQQHIAVDTWPTNGSNTSDHAVALQRTSRQRTQCAIETSQYTTHDTQDTQHTKTHTT